MEIRGENYFIQYDPSTSTVKLEGILRLYGASGYFSIDDYNKHRDVPQTETNPNAPYLSIMELFEAIAKEHAARITINLRGLELLNSSGINVLSKFVIRLRENKNSVLLVKGTQQFFWQGKVLQNLQKLMPSIKVEFE